MNKDHITAVVQKYERMPVSTRTEYRKWLYSTAQIHIREFENEENNTYAREMHISNVLDILQALKEILSDVRYNDVIWELLGMMEYGDYEDPGISL